MLNRSFVFGRSTIVATMMRLLLIAVSHSDQLRNPVILPISNYIYSPIVQSVFVRPHQTIKHVQEANSIRQVLSDRFFNAYQANKSIRLPPLILAAISPFCQIDKLEDDRNFYASLFLLVVDFLIACLIWEVGRSNLLPEKPNIHEKEEIRLQNHLPLAIQPQNAHIFPLTRDSMTPRKQLGNQDQKNDTGSYNSSQEPFLQLLCLPTLASQLYYWSPITALAGGTYHCFQNLPCFFLLACIHESCRQGKRARSLSTFYLAVAAYIEPHFVVFLVPAMILASRECTLPKPNGMRTMMVLTFACWSIIFQILSYFLTGPGIYASMVDACYGFRWKNLSPNLSLLWYFQIQLFGRFRDYFGIQLTGLPYVLVAPLTVRLYKYPMALIAIFWFISTIFRPFQTLHDLNVGLCFFLLSPRSLARVTLPIFCFALCSLWVPVILYVVDSWMWLEVGNGNANYIYFQCLGYNVFLGILVGQFCSATLQRDKALRLTAKNQLAMSGDKRK